MALSRGRSLRRHRSHDRRRAYSRADRQPASPGAALCDRRGDRDMGGRPDGSTVINQQILVERDSQKAIVIGKGGRRLKAIGTAARAEIRQHLGRPVHLLLHVKVNPRWDEDRGLYREMGLEWAD